MEPLHILQVGNVLVSPDIFTEKFCCDLSKCKGQCCVEGDAGAPVTLDETMAIENALDTVWGDLSASAQSVIDKQGVAYTDVEGELVTSIVGGRDCVFTCYDEKGFCYCAIEKAYRAGKTDFYKPVSCHLYPIRVSNFGKYKAVNYHRWEICKAAVLLGEKEGVPVYKFLEKPLIRKFGQAWFDELEIAVDELKKAGYIKE